MKENTCCFIGHRKIEVTKDLEEKIKNVLEKLIKDENVNIFLFGSRSQFDTLCLKIVSELKKDYKNLKRVYVRGEFEKVSDSYVAYLLKSYDDTFYPSECVGSGKVSYIKRNEAMIKLSDFCLFFYDKNYVPPQKIRKKTHFLEKNTNSGTKLAFEFAKRKKKNLTNFCDD